MATVTHPSLESRLDELQVLNDPRVVAPLRPDIREVVAVFADRFPESVFGNPALVPTADGRLQLEWHSGTRVLEFEFESPTWIRWLRWDPTAGVDEEGDIACNDVHGLQRHLIWFRDGRRA